MRVALVVSICSFSAAFASVSRIVSVQRTGGAPGWSLVDGCKSEAVACANFTDSLETTGWTFFHGDAKGTALLSDAAFGMGFAEGVLTQTHIFAAFKNFASTFYKNATLPPPQALDFVRD